MSCCTLDEPEPQRRYCHEAEQRHLKAAMLCLLHWRSYLRSETPAVGTRVTTYSDAADIIWSAHDGPWMYATQLHD